MRTEVNGMTRANLLRSGHGWLADAELARTRGENAYARDCETLAARAFEKASDLPD